MKRKNDIVKNSELIKNIEKIHTTKLGIDRIKKNLNLDSNDVVDFIKKIVLDKNTDVYKQGKNWYCKNNDIIVTINASSYTIITTHKKEPVQNR